MFNVTLSSGQLCHFALDFSFPGFIPVEFDRFYMSQFEHDGPLGHGWTFPYQSYLEIGEDRFNVFESVYAPIPYEFKEIDADGVYKKSSTTIERSLDSVIVRKPSAAYHFTALNRTSRLVLTKWEDGCGNALRFEYDRDGRLDVLTDTMERRFRFTYNGDGRIQEIALLKGASQKSQLRLVLYQYAADGKLAAAIDPLDHASRYEYDSHLMVAYTNRNGGRYLAQYDKKGRCTRTWREDGRLVREYHFDDKNNCGLVTDTHGQRTLHRFDKAGLTLEEINPSGDKVTYVYDQAGRIITSTDETGASALTLFDKNLNQFIVADRAGAVVKLALLEEQSAREIIDGLGGVWRYEYETTGRLKRFVFPSQAAWNYAYDSRGALIAQTSPLGRTVRYVFNDNYTAQTVRDDIGVLEESRYDRHGRQVELRRALEEPQFFKYDALGRLLAFVRPNGSTASFGWDDEGNLTSVTEADGSTVQLIYNRFNELEAIINPLGRRRRYEYDLECYLIRIWNENNETLELEIDGLGHVVRQTFFDGRVERYRYDSGGRLTELLDGAGRRRGFEFDPEGRLVQVVDCDGRETEYIYNAVGSLVVAMCDKVEVAFKYDADGHLIAETQDGETLEHTYDAAGNRLSTRLPTGEEIIYRYDYRNRVTEVLTPAGRSHHFTYDGRDRPLKWSLPGAQLSVEYGYHAFDRPKSLNVNGPTRLTRAFEYDSRGRISSVQDGAARTTLMYSSLDEVLEVRRDGQAPEVYRYDPAGNLLAALSGMFVYQAGNRLVGSGPRRYEYNGCGGLAAWEEKPDRSVLTYDGMERLVRVDHPDGKTTAFTYDPLGRRLSKVHDGVKTRYLWDGDHLIAEWTPDQNRRLIYLRRPGSGVVIGLSDGDSDYGLVGDPLGFPPTHLFDDAGQVVWSASYTLWGGANETASAGLRSRVRYLGQHYDAETGLCYNYHRYYDPETGRFVTPDPIGINGGLLNLYMYAPNPLGYIDPLGLAPPPVDCSKHCATNPCKPTKQSTNVPNQIPGQCNPSRGSSIHNACINQALAKARAIDPDARRDQGQVAGAGIGSNRPDLSFKPPGGPQTFVEFDNPPFSRVGQHVSDICGNNPSAQVFLVSIPANSRFTTPGSATSGSIPRNTPGRPTEAECGW
jgi:RHS repeat-associated protein